MANTKTTSDERTSEITSGVAGWWLAPASDAAVTSMDSNEMATTTGRMITRRKREARAGENDERTSQYLQVDRIVTTPLELLSEVK